MRRTMPTLDRIPSRTIRPPTLPPPPPPRIPINQLPRIHRRAGAPSRSRPTATPPTTNPTHPTGPSFLDNLLHSQERLHNLQNVRMHG